MVNLFGPQPHRPLGACPSNGPGCENGACEARSRQEEEVDAWPSATTTNAEIVRNPHSPFGLQAASAHLLRSGSSEMAEQFGVTTFLTNTNLFWKKFLKRFLFPMRSIRNKVTWSRKFRECRSRTNRKLARLEFSGGVVKAPSRKESTKSEKTLLPC